jgi:hypothetical protein
VDPPGRRRGEAHHGAGHAALMPDRPRARNLRAVRPRSCCDRDAVRTATRLWRETANARIAATGPLRSREGARDCGPDRPAPPARPPE